MSPSILTLVLVFAAVAGGVYGLALLLGGGPSTRDRLRLLERRPGTATPARAAPWRLALRRLAGPIARLASPSGASADAVSADRVRFLRAGLRGATAPLFFLAAKTLLTFGLPLLALIGLQLLGFRLDNLNSLIAILLAAAIGYYVPNVLLALRTRRRQREVFEAFPDAVDMMVVCVEAGIGLDAAIARSAAEMEIRSTVMAEELKLVSAEMRVGASREQALRNLALRNGLEEIGSFVAMLVQADRFGTSVADSLRVQSDTLRVKRRQRAEEQAAKLPTKLLFPLIFCIFPSLLLVLLGPSMVQVYRVLFPTMVGN